MVNTFFNKVLNENKKCVLFLLLKPKELFGQPNVGDIQIAHSF